MEKGSFALALLEETGDNKGMELKERIRMLRAKMREAALLSRSHTVPSVFDGTLATYNRNIFQAYLLLREAKCWRAAAVKLEKQLPV